MRTHLVSSQQRYRSLKPKPAGRGTPYPVDHASPVATAGLAELAQAWIPGLSSRCETSASRSSKRFSIHTGLPNAPARWATAVSTAMTRSRSGDQSGGIRPVVQPVGDIEQRAPAARRCSCAPAGRVAARRRCIPGRTAGAPCRTAASSGAGRWRRRAAERCGICRPRPSRPSARAAGQKSAQGAGSARRYDSGPGMVSCVVPNASGRLSSGQW